jgi:hypothetical protein
MGKKSKSSSRKRSKAKRQLKPQQDQLCTKKTCKKILTSLRGQIVFLVGIIGFFFAVWPRLSIYPGQTLDPYRPFETSFIIKNDGYLPLFDVNYSVKAEDIQTVNQNEIQGVIARGFSEKIPKLRADTSSTIFINRFVKAPPRYITYAEIYFYITYKPFLPLFSLTEIRRFKIDRMWNGQYVWNEYYSKE